MIKVTGTSPGATSGVQVEKGVKYTINIWTFNQPQPPSPPSLPSASKATKRGRDELR